MTPNPRLQRTPSAPLSRQPFGAGARVAAAWCFVLGNLVLVQALVLAIGCVRTIVDYSFRAEGVVTDASGRAIPNTRVTLDISTTVYKAITPVTSSDTYTDEQGRFAFWYISHEPDPPYTLGFEKPGYQSVMVEGAVQAMNPHSVRMTPVAK